MAAAGQFHRVIDVSVVNLDNLVGYEDLGDHVHQIYAQFGQISAIFPWESNLGKTHFYVEYTDTASVKRARAAVIPDFACFVISKDKQHRKRFASLSSRTLPNGASGLAPKATRGAIRYSPYTIPGGSQASHYVAGDYARSSHAPGHLGGNPSSDFLPNQGTPSPLSHSLSPRYNGHNNTEIPPPSEEGMFLTEHLGSCIAAVNGDHVSASFLQTSPNPSSFRTAPQQILKVLSDLREKKAQVIGESNHSHIRHRIHPKFDFRQYITSGRFLLPNSADAHTTFKLTPLQAYFADIYGSLQSELHETKRAYKQNLFLLEQQKILCQNMKDEAADERSHRRHAEKQVEDLQSSLEAVTEAAIGHRQAEEQYASELEDARGEIEKLRRTIGHIQSIVAGPAQSLT